MPGAADDFLGGEQPHDLGCRHYRSIAAQQQGFDRRLIKEEQYRKLWSTNCSTG